MKIIFSDHPMPTSVTKSLFLAGPSPREKTVLDWRIEALEVLKSLSFTGEVFIPIPEARFYGGDDSADWTYDNQIEWECTARHIADQIVFWVPRQIKAGMPGFTTNVEFGEDLASGKIIYGRPDDADKCRYLDKRIQGAGLNVYNTLESLLQATLEELGEGALRQKGEVHVPLFVWRSKQFQKWYANLKAAGNRLDGAKLLHHFSPAQGKVFSFVLSVNIWVEAEQRNKSNEFIMSRPSLCAVLAYHRDVNQVTHVVLVKEFRSTVSDPSGYVYELPGGSTTRTDVTPEQVAQHELEEETGLRIETLERFVLCSEGQVNATFSTHTAKLYRVRLTDDEFRQVREDAASGKVFGVKGESERTAITIINVSDIGSLPLDFVTKGMILTGTP